MARASEPTDPRRVAWEILLAVERGGFADALVGRNLRALALNERDRALAVRLVYGTLAWQGCLDSIVARVCRPPEKLDEPIRVLLRLALFQLTRLTRVPDFAAVNTAVEMAKSHRGGSASGLVNAALRRFLREGNLADDTPPEADRAAVLSRTWSHPYWLARQWVEELGETEAAALMAANNEAAPTVVRVNVLRADRDRLIEIFAKAGVAARPGEFSPEAVVLESGGDPERLPGFSDGLFSVQGEASQLATRLVGAGAGMRILDACAAPGGKSTCLAERMGDTGMVAATDTHRAGLARLRREAKRLGLTCIDATCADATRPPREDEPLFDAVLLDAPCSGLGTLRQHPEIKWRRTAESLAATAATQRRLLGAVVRRVRAGGAVVYATCTVSQAENERNVSGFLADHPEFEVDPPQRFLPDPARAFVDAAGFLRTFPHHGALDGFFAARLKRRG